jgi:GNAT superfamily N-acetyltransferase
VSPSLAVRELCDGDSIAELTDLIHRAYAPFGALGLNYTAVDQSGEETARRAGLGRCAVAHLDGVLVGTITAQGPNPSSTSSWVRLLHVASAHQFAVEPSLQRNGIGSALLLWSEHWAKSQGYTELCVDTAEPAAQLIAFYHRRGYRFIEFAQWRGKTYRTVVLSKSIIHAP